jgi:hypothetical protein
MEKYMGENPSDNYRNEVKFILPISSYLQVIMELQLNGFYEHFPERTVNSVYFDTLGDQMLFDSIYGYGNRNKIRIRYYNDEMEDIKLEQKIKKNNVGKKIISNINPTLLSKSNFEISSHISILVMQNVFIKSKVIYERRYFYNKMSDVRITLDQNISTEDLENGKIRKFLHLIFEIKYYRNPIHQFTFLRNQVRFSKYVFSRVGDDTIY